MQILALVGAGLFIASWYFQRMPTVHHYVTDLTITFADSSGGAAQQQKQVGRPGGRREGRERVDC